MLQSYISFSTKRITHMQELNNLRSVPIGSTHLVSVGRLGQIQDLLLQSPSHHGLKPCGHSPHLVPAPQAVVAGHGRPDGAFRLGQLGASGRWWRRLAVVDDTAIPCDGSRGNLPDVRGFNLGVAGNGVGADQLFWCCTSW